MSTGIQNRLEHIEDFIINDNLQEALNIIKKLPSIKKITSEDELIGLAFKSEILNKLGDFEKATKLADLILNKSKELKEANLAKIDALIQKSYAEALLGKYDNSITCFNEADLIFDKMQNYPIVAIEKRKAKYYFSKSNFYFSKWNLSEGLKQAKKCLKSAEIINHKELILMSSFYITAFYLYKGDYEKLAMKLIDYKKLAESFKSNIFIGLGYFLQADLARYLENDFKKSIDLYKKCISYVEKSGSKYILYTIYSNLGGLYRDMLELDNALKCYQKSLELIKVKPALGIVKNHIGTIYRLKREPNKALENYYEALKLFNQMDMVYLIPGQLYSIIENLVEIKNLREARKYLKQFEQYNARAGFKKTEHVYNFCKALILKATRGFKNLAEAITIFKELLKVDLSIDWKIKILLNLTEILLWELEETDDPQTIKEVSKCLKQLHDIADEYQYNIFKIDISTIIAHFHLLEFNYGEAMEVLDDAILLASEKELHFYIDEIKEEIKKITHKINYLKKLDDDRLTKEQKRLLENLQEKHRDVVAKTKLEKRNKKGEITRYDTLFVVRF